MPKTDQNTPETPPPKQQFQAAARWLLDGFDCGELESRAGALAVWAGAGGVRAVSCDLRLAPSTISRAVKRLRQHLEEITNAQ